MMKTTFLSLCLIMASFVSYGKKVKFAVDMTGQTVSANGVHIAGDFQTAAGFSGGDWISNTTTLTQEGATTIYSIVVELPAFAKYEYKFINGDQFYEAEFVPVESRVGYDFDDNRWLYVDSLANDTTFVGAIVFAANAPDGKDLVRLYVDMQNETVSTDGIHVAGDFQNWDPQATILYNFQNAIYEVIAYVDSGTIAYKFYNGNTLLATETVPSDCAVSDNRSVTISDHTLLDVVCFSSCTTCGSAAGIQELATVSISLAPNPTASVTQLTVSAVSGTYSVIVSDMNGQVVRSYADCNSATVQLEKAALHSGLYFVTIQQNGTTTAPAKWVIE